MPASAPPRYLPRQFPWLQRPGLWWFGFALWLATVFTLSSIAGPQLPQGPEVPNLDKIVHAVLYGAGAFTLATALTLSRPASARLHLICAVVISLIGAVDELYQLRTPGRSGADVFDWLADAVGAITVCVLLGALARRTPPNPQ